MISVFIIGKLTKDLYLCYTKENLEIWSEKYGIYVNIIGVNTEVAFQNILLSPLYNFFAFPYISCGRDRMVVGFITTYAISAYHH